MRYLQNPRYIVPFIFIIAALNGVCLGTRNGNLEYWQTVGVRFDLNDDLLVTVDQEIKTGRESDNIHLYNLEVGIIRKGITDWLDIGLNFKKEYIKVAGKYRHENRLHLNFYTKGKLFGLDSINRTRIEYRDRELLKDVFRLRNGLKIKLPYKLTALELQPFLAEEFFLNLNGDGPEGSGINQNRLYAGFSFEPAKDVTFRLYYAFKKTKTPVGWLDTNVIGTQIIFQF
ncbi:MAG: DUF2490 domain-containing protein [Planctomycetota bacterium]|jgi:hypothetical protein